MLDALEINNYIDDGLIVENIIIIVDDDILVRNIIA